MQQQACDADELYVLGDLFETWIGDDAADETAEEAIAAFRQFSDKGGKLYFIRGNRDFLIGDDFAKATGGTILHQPYKLSIAGQTSLLMHGDCLCTEDHKYIAFREQSRSPEWQQQFLSQSIEQRRELAQQIRNTSLAKRRAEMPTMTDVTASEVERLMVEAEATLLIHGHTHRQNRHSLTINNKPAERIVLGDWGDTGCVLIVEDNDLELFNFSLEDN